MQKYNRKISAIWPLIAKWGDYALLPVPAKVSPLDNEHELKKFRIFFSCELSGPL